MSERMAPSFFEKLSPTGRRNLALAGFIAAFVVLLYLFTHATPKPEERRQSTSTVERNVLTGADPHSLGMDALTAQMSAMQERLKEVRAQMDRQETSTAQKFAAVEGAIERTSADAAAVRHMSLEEAAKLREEQQRAAQAGGGKQDEAKPEEGASVVPGLPIAPAPPPQRSPARPASDSPWGPPPSLPANAQQVAPAPAMNAAPKVRIITSGAPPQKPQASAREKEEDEGIWIPSGAILPGLLLSGVEAVTEMRASGEPTPALFRVKFDAILPNRYTADLKECFVIVSTRGELSSERVHMRGETLSCVRTDGAVLETDIEGFINGEDGKAGMRGKLVHRSGQLVARAALAGLVSGLSDAFKPVAVNTISTDASDGISYISKNTSDALQSAGYSGASKAADRLADYWLDLADEILPVLEVQGGRNGDFVLLKGLRLKVRGGGISAETALTDSRAGQLLVVGARLPAILRDAAASTSAPATRIYK